MPVKTTMYLSNRPTLGPTVTTAYESDIRYMYSLLSHVIRRAPAIT